MAGNVLSGLYTEDLCTHGEIGKLVRSQLVVGLKARVEALQSPCTTYGRIGVEDDQRLRRLKLVKGLGCCYTCPAWIFILSTSLIICARGREPRAASC